MKSFNIILLISLSFIYSTNYEGAHYLVLDDLDSTIDGEQITSTPKNGVSLTSSETTDIIVLITESNTYVVSGKLTGQLKVKVEDTDHVILVLNNVDINCSTDPAIFFHGGYEIYDKTTKITYEVARALDFTNAGAKIIIADDSVNTINGAHSDSQDGAISSKVSMSISGETKGNGVLNLVADTEGMEVKNHLLIDGGVINIAAQDDGINIKEDDISTCLIKNGIITVNGGLGKEGDGIDSNGYLIIEGGTVVSASKPNADSGLDSNLGLVINGGSAVGVGTPMDEADNTCEQTTINLQFSSNVAATSTLKIVDSNGNEVFSFRASTAGFYPGTSVRTYSGATISSPKFVKGATYYLYLDGVQLTNGGSREGGGSHPHFGKFLGATATSTSFIFTYNATTFLTVKKAS